MEVVGVKFGEKTLTITLDTQGLYESVTSTDHGLKIPLGNNMKNRFNGEKGRRKSTKEKVEGEDRENGCPNVTVPLDTTLNLKQMMTIEQT